MKAIRAAGVPCTINAKANGTWAQRRGEHVDLLTVASNGRAAVVRDAERHEYDSLPVSWLTSLNDEGI